VAIAEPVGMYQLKTLAIKDTRRKTMKHIKTVTQVNNDQEQGWIINDRVLIDTNGTLWNLWYADKKPYKNFPKYYFNLRDQLLAEAV